MYDIEYLYKVAKMADDAVAFFAYDPNLSNPSIREAYTIVHKLLDDIRCKLPSDDDED